MGVIKISNYNSSNVANDTDWTTIQWMSTMNVSTSNGARQKVTLAGNTTINQPTLSATNTELVLQIAKTSQYSFTIGGVTTPASETTLLSWYWDGSQTRRMPNVYLGD